MASLGSPPQIRENIAITIAVASAVVQVAAVVAAGVVAAVHGNWLPLEISGGLLVGGTIGDHLLYRWPGKVPFPVSVVPWASEKMKYWDGLPISDGWREGLRAVGRTVQGVACVPLYAALLLDPHPPVFTLSCIALGALFVSLYHGSVVAGKSGIVQ